MLSHLVNSNQTIMEGANQAISKPSPRKNLVVTESSSGDGNNQLCVITCVPRGGGDRSRSTGRGSSLP